MSVEGDQVRSISVGDEAEPARSAGIEGGVGSMMYTALETELSAIPDLKAMAFRGVEVVIVNGPV